MALIQLTGWFTHFESELGMKGRNFPTEGCGASRLALCCMQ